MMEKKLTFLSAGAFGLCALLYGLIACISGGSLLGLVLYGLAYLFGVLFCGYFLNDCLNTGSKGLSALPIAFCLGTFFVYLNFIVLSVLHAERFCLVVPILLGCWYLKKKMSLQAFSKPALRWHHCILLLTGCVFFGFFIFCALLPYARADKTINFYLHQDMIWSVGNAASVHLGFPIQDMRFSGTRLNYHYLNDVLAGLLGLGAGAPAYESLCFYYYPLVALTLIPALYKVARLVCSNQMLCALFPALVLFGTSAGGSTFHYVTNINGQGGATLTLCAGLLFVSQLGRDQKVTASKLLTGLLLGFVISMFKSTIGALFILAVFAAWLVGLFTKQSSVRQLPVVLSLALGFAVAYFFIFSNAVNNLVFAGLAGIATLPKVLVTAVPVGIVLYLISLLFSLRHFKALPWVSLIANAMFVGGAVALVTYSHYSASQIYFLLIAIPMMWLSCLPVLELLVGNKKALLVTAAVAVLLFTGWSARSMLGEARTGVQALLRVCNLRVTTDYNESFVTEEDYEALTWLRDNTPQSAVFATNRNNKSFEAGEGVFHYYTAISQRACYLESYRYCMDYSGMYHEVRRRLEQVSDPIFHTDSEAAAFSTARQEGIDYLVVFAPVSNPVWQKSPVFENDTVKIYKVND